MSAGRSLLPPTIRFAGLSGDRSSVFGRSLISEVAAGVDTVIFVSAPAILSCFPAVAFPEMGDVPISSIGCPLYRRTKVACISTSRADLLRYPMRRLNSALHPPIPSGRMFTRKEDPACRVLFLPIGDRGYQTYLLSDSEPQPSTRTGPPPLTSLSVSPLMQMA